MKIISVIVPIYNDEKYLKKCIDSILNQTIGIENIELILVDDNSTDKSYSIIQKYKKQYSNNIIIQKLEENSGYGGKPRNVGIELASGKYLMFSDADDFFAEDALEKMYNAIEQKESDFIISNWNYTNATGKIWDKPVFDNERFENFKLDINDYKDSFWVMNSSMCNKIFRRKFINDNKIRCLENVPGEDSYFSMTAFLNSENVYYINDITYFYRQRNKKKKDSSSSWNCSKRFFEGMNISYKKIYEEFLKHNQLEFYRFVYARNMTYLLYRFIDSTLINREEKLEILPKLRWFFELSYKLKVPACQNSLEILINKIVGEKYEEAIDICEIIAELRTYMDTEVRHQMSKPYEKMYQNILNEKVNLKAIIKSESF